MTSIHDFEAIGIDGNTMALSGFRGKVLLIVNTASRCGFTPQFEGLQTLHQTYAERGFVVLGFPSNQFANQDPGSNDEIGAFCARNYGVTFPMMARIDVNGAGAAPLFQWLAQQRPGFMGTRALKWNFTKFLIGRDGSVLRRFAPIAKPASIARAIEAALAA